MIIAVCEASAQVNEEWAKYKKERGEDFTPFPPAHQDYALMKVLSQLRQYKRQKAWIQTFRHEAGSSINFTSLQKDDTIYIVGHGNQYGLKALGVFTSANKKENMDRFFKLLTADGSLKKKSKTMPIKIMLLSCRSGLGLDVLVVDRLRKDFGQSAEISVGGAIGFTFGSPRTLSTARTEVLIHGIPWYIEYPESISKEKADEITRNREKNSSLSYDAKIKEITEFVKAKEALEKKFKDMIKKLKSTEVNKALDELYKDFQKQWDDTMTDQFNLYFNAKTASKLEFDMWWGDIEEPYRWVDSSFKFTEKDIIQHYNANDDKVPGLTTTIR
jgi:hypothetical protein